MIDFISKIVLNIERISVNIDAKKKNKKHENQINVISLTLLVE